MKGNAGNPRIDIGLLILRIGLGSVVFIYGCQKAFGIFGGQGYSPTITYMTGKLGIHPVFANLSVAAECLGSLGIVFGFLTPVAAIGLACNFAVATYMNGRNGGFSEAFSSPDPTRLSILAFPFTLFLMSLALLVLGAGRYSLDARFFPRRKSK